VGIGDPRYARGRVTRRPREGLKGRFVSAMWFMTKPKGGPAQFVEDMRRGRGFRKGLRAVDGTNLPSPR